MISKSFLASRVSPKLVHEIAVKNALGKNNVLQVWTTTCIVSNFAIATDTTSTNRVLVNPSNPGLTGCSNFTYFPRGGPVPDEPVKSTVHRDWQPLGYVSSWGGMEVGSGMMYPVSVIDGLVHQQGGWKLQTELRVRRMVNNGLPCPIGSAVRTTAGDISNYDAIVHTTPPFYTQDESPRDTLTKSYESALDSISSGEFVALPLLGAGCRGFPVDIAGSVASTAVLQFLTTTQTCSLTIVFGLIDPKVASQLKDFLETESGF